MQCAEKINTFWHRMNQPTTVILNVVDRPKGTKHPRYPMVVYPLDYGCLENTTSNDGGSLDVWPGYLNSRTLTGILCMFDTLKRDA
jgi:inorganic pyrophosphatase